MTSPSAMRAAMRSWQVDAVAGPGHRFQPLGRNRLVALQADAVVVVIDAVQCVGNLAQQLHIDGIAVQEDPFFVMLLAEVSLIGGNIQAGHHLGRFLGGHAATDFFGFRLQHLAVPGKIGLLSVFVNRFHVFCKYRSHPTRCIRRTFNTKGFRVSRGSVRRGMEKYSWRRAGKVKRAPYFTNPYKGLATVSFGQDSPACSAIWAFEAPRRAPAPPGRDRLQCRNRPPRR